MAWCYPLASTYMIAQHYVSLGELSCRVQQHNILALASLFRFCFVPSRNHKKIHEIDLKLSSCVPIALAKFFLLLNNTNDRNILVNFLQVV